MKLRTNCAICHADIVPVLNMPKFPLTGIYVDKPTQANLYDQTLMFCPRCGHGQLQDILDPKEIYNGTYSHRSSDSAISRNGNANFANWITKVTKGKKFNSALDVGCSDGYLMKLLNTTEVRGIDAAVDGVFIESAELGNPDLVVSSHTFEHIEEPKEQLKRMVEAATEDAWFFITVPCLDTMIINSRWDQVFHQHLHYYSLSSMVRLIGAAGCHVVDHAYDYNYWGGTLMVAFQKGTDSFRVGKPTTEEIRESTKTFFYQLSCFEVVINKLKNDREQVVGFGAAQMLPTLDYYVKFSDKLDCVYDDNESRVGKTWPGDSPMILKTPEDLSQYNVVITAPDSAREIIKRCVDLKAKRILVPFQVI